MVYVIRSDHAEYKIGYTKNGKSFTKRLYALQICNTRKLEKLLLAEGSHQDEKALHRLLDKFRIRGEWFSDARWRDPLFTHVLNLLERYGAPFVLSHSEEQLYNFCPIPGHWAKWVPDFSSIKDKKNPNAVHVKFPIEFKDVRC